MNLNHIEILIVEIAHAGSALGHFPEDVIDFAFLLLQTAYAVQLARLRSGVHAVIDPWRGA